MIKQVSDEMMQWKTKGTKLYQQLPKEMYESWKECGPLRYIFQKKIFHKLPIIKRGMKIKNSFYLFSHTTFLFVAFAKKSVSFPSPFPVNPPAGAPK